jgi:arginine deiminase
MPVDVTSEIGQLETVLVHTPGPELLAVTPGNREDYLYDDIIDLEIAQREHRQFVSVLRRFARVLQVRELLAEILAQPAAREFLITKTMDVVESDELAQRLGTLPAGQIVEMLIEGTREETGPIARALNEEGFAFPPLPNLFFPRDIGMVLGRRVVVGSMRYDVRWTEELLIKALFTFHPELANEGVLYDGSEERRSNYSLEGGDVHYLRPDLLVVGFSERSSPAALDELCDTVFAQGTVTDVIVVVMPKAPTAIHLDMIFTHVDRELCVLYPPHFVGPERLSVLLWRKGQAQVKEMPSVFAAFGECALPLEPIFCGGDRRIMQEREQWASGCNFVALRPGLVASYARNEATLREMEKMGFRIVPSVEFLSGQQRVAEGDRAVLTFEGGELVRGGGGPRCMTLPVAREDVWA